MKLPRYSTLDRTFELRSPSYGEYGYKPDYKCTCGNTFDEDDLINVIHSRATWNEPEDGSSYSPCCRTEDWDENDERPFTATRRRTIHLNHQTEARYAA